MVDLCFILIEIIDFPANQGKLVVLPYSRTPHFPAKWGKWLVFPIKLRKAKVKKI
jgi:hypothetical protein